MSKSAAYFEGFQARLATNERKEVPDSLGVFLYNIKADDGSLHNWVIDFKNFTVTKGTTASPDVTISVSDDDFHAIHSKQISGEEAQSLGKIKIEGNLAMAAELKTFREAQK